MTLFEWVERAQETARRASTNNRTLVGIPLRRERQGLLRLAGDLRNRPRMAITFARSRHGRRAHAEALVARAVDAAPRAAIGVVLTRLAVARTARFAHEVIRAVGRRAARLRGTPPISAAREAFVAGHVIEAPADARLLRVARAHGHLADLVRTTAVRIRLATIARLAGATARKRARCETLERWRLTVRVTVAALRAGARVVSGAVSVRSHAGPMATRRDKHDHDHRAHHTWHCKLDAANKAPNARVAFSEIRRA